MRGLLCTLPTPALCPPMPVTGDPASPEVIEHAMAVCSDEILVAMVVDAPTGSRKAAGILGRILSAQPSTVPAGSPLVAWVTGADVDPDWKDHCTLVPGCLLEQLGQLRGLTSSKGPFPHLFAEWLVRSEDFDSNFMGQP